MATQVYLVMSHARGRRGRPSGSIAYNGNAVTGVGEATPPGRCHVCSGEAVVFRLQTTVSGITHPPR